MTLTELSANPRQLLDMMPRIIIPSSVPLHLSRSEASEVHWPPDPRQFHPSFPYCSGCNFNYICILLLLTFYICIFVFIYFISLLFYSFIQIYFYSFIQIYFYSFIQIYIFKNIDCYFIYLYIYTFIVCNFIQIYKYKFLFCINIHFYIYTFIIFCFCLPAWWGHEEKNLKP